MVLSRGRPLFLTQIEWDLTLILTSHIKVRKVSSFGRYMYSEYIRVVQIEKKRVWIFIAEIYALNVHPWRLSILFVDFPRWSCLVLICFPRLFSFSLILHFFLILSWLSHMWIYVAFSLGRWTLCLVTTFQFYLCQWIVSFMSLSLSVSFILSRISTRYDWHPL